MNQQLSQPSRPLPEYSNPARSASGHLRRFLSEESAQRLEAFWDGGELDRPVLHVKYRNPDAPQNFEWSGDGVSGKARDRSVEWNFAFGEHLLNQEICLAEAIPQISFGHSDNIGLQPVLAGGAYNYKDGHAWIQLWEEVLEHTLPMYDPNHPDAATILDFMRKGPPRYADRAFVNPIVLGMDALTTLSLFMTAEELCMELLEGSDRVKDYLEAFDAMTFALHQDVLGILHDQGQYLSSSWFHLVAPGSLQAVQCDFGTMISPAMYEEYAVPMLERSTRHFDYSLYHLDGTCQVRFLDALSKLPNLNGIQWNPEPGESIVKWIPTYKEIRDRGWLLHFNNWDITLDEALKVVRALGPQGLSIALSTFDNKADADAAIRAIESLCG